MLEILRQGAQSWGIKIIFGIIIAVFVLAFGVSRMQNGATIVAEVNGVPILAQDYQEQVQHSLDMLRDQNPGLTPEVVVQMGFKKQILEQMIMEEVMRQKAADLGVFVSKEELAAEIHQIPVFQSKDKVFDPVTYQKVLQANSLTPGKFESEYMRGMLMQKLKAYLGLPGRVGGDQARDFYTFGRSSSKIAYLMFPWEQYQKQVQPTPKQVDEYYAAHKVDYAVPAMTKIDALVLTPETLADGASVLEKEIQDYYAKHKEMFKREEQVKARHILVLVNEDAPKAEQDKARKQIQAAEKELERGKSFVQVAAKYSQDPSSAKNGGSLGWFGRGRMVKSFEEAAFSLKPNTVSKPVRTSYGWHLLLVEDTKPSGYADFKTVADEIRGTIARDRAAETLQDRLDQALELVVGGKSLNDVAKSIGLGLHVQESGFFTKNQGPSELASLSPENVEVLFDLPVGSTTQTPLPLKDGYVLATKRMQVPETTKPLETVKTQILTAIVKTEALKIAKATAQKERVALDAGQDSRVKPVETAAFGRQSAVPGLGMNPELVKAVFAATPGSWLPEPYAVASGYVLVKALGVTPPTEKEWSADKELWLMSLNQRAEEQAVQAFVMELRRQADVRIADPAQLEN